MWWTAGYGRSRRRCAADEWRELIGRRRGANGDFKADSSDRYTGPRFCNGAQSFDPVSRLRQQNRSDSTHFRNPLCVVPNRGPLVGQAVPDAGQDTRHQCFDRAIRKNCCIFDYFPTATHMQIKARRRFCGEISDLVVGANGCIPNMRALSTNGSQRSVSTNESTARTRCEERRLRSSTKRPAIFERCKSCLGIPISRIPSDISAWM